MELNLLDGSLNPVNIGRVIKHNHDFYKSHPGYFRPEGLLVFCGEQGSGKTLSAGNMLRNFVVNILMLFYVPMFKFLGLILAHM